MTDLTYKPPVRAAEVGRHVRFASGRRLAKFVQLARKCFKVWAHGWITLYHFLLFCGCLAIGGYACGANTEVWSVHGDTEFILEFCFAQQND